MPLLEVIYANQQTYKNFIYKVLKEYLFDVQIVYYFPKNFHLIHAIDEKIGILKAAGLVSLWMDTYIDKSYLKILYKTVGPRKIKLEQLHGALEIWICGIVLSMFVFMLESFTKCRCLKKFKLRRKYKEQKVYKHDILFQDSSFVQNSNQILLETAWK